MDEGSCDDYLCAIRQAEKVVPHEDLKRYLLDRTAMPCFDFELEEAVKLWLGGRVQAVWPACGAQRCAGIF